MAAPRFSATDLQVCLPLDGKRRRVTAPDETEEELQKRIVEQLRRDGWLVLVTSRRRHMPKCPSCFRILDFCFHCKRSLWVFNLKRKRRVYSWPIQPDGCDEGIPDLLIRRPTWPRYLFAGIEVKGRRTAVSDRQKELAAEGAIAVSRSLEEVQGALLEVEAALIFCR